MKTINEDLEKIQLDIRKGLQADNNKLFSLVINHEGFCEPIDLFKYIMRESDLDVDSLANIRCSILEFVHEAAYESKDQDEKQEYLQLLHDLNNSLLQK